MLTLVLIHYILHLELDNAECARMLHDGDHVVQIADECLVSSALHGTIGNDVGGWGEDVRPSISVSGDTGFSLTVETSIDGEFSIEVPDGMYCIRVEHVGWQPYIQRVQIKEGAASLGLNISLSLSI